MVTIKQIAELCGVSRGTVDRVINKRGKVKPEKEQLILETMRKLNYSPNPAGKALAARKKQPTVGVLIPSIGVHFFDDVISSMQNAARRYASYGLKIIWRSMRGFDEMEQCQLIDELAPQVQALIINPVNGQAVLERLNALAAEGLYIITLNNDLPGLRRHCYIGTDFYSGGRTAGALLQMIGARELHIGILLGSHKMLSHQRRLEGFRSALEERFKKGAPGSWEILSVQETEDDDILAYEEIKTLLQEHPETNAIFVISSGASYGAARAVQAAGRAGSITMVVFDTIPSTIRMMQAGVIQAALYQHPHQQGRRAMQVAFEYLVNGAQPEKDSYIMRNEIRIPENAED